MLKSVKVGFGAAVLTNIIECVQNVFSKRLSQFGELCGLVVNLHLLKVKGLLGSSFVLFLFRLLASEYTASQLARPVCTGTLNPKPQTLNPKP